MNGADFANIRSVLANADHPIATLELSGTRVIIGIDESDSDPTLYLCLPDVCPDRKAFMSPCETSLLIAALVAGHCQLIGKDNG
jgi:hypothetical protein